jgi:hypothetical protein
MLPTFSQNRKYFENFFQEIGKNAEYSFSWNRKKNRKLFF